MSSENPRDSIATSIRDKGQYLLAFGVIASLLVVANIPIFVVFFFGVFAYFLAKMFSASGKNRTRSIFEFYLSAHEILRDDLRCWYGFEINETIERGESILRSMREAPALVHFAIGALYHKAGDHSSAVKHLAYLVENPESLESNIVYPSSELRNYVSVLRKIERDPASAPLTSAAVRSLERSRKIKAETLLADSRKIAANSNIQQSALLDADSERSISLEGEAEKTSPGSVVDMGANGIAALPVQKDDQRRPLRTNGKSSNEKMRKPITELLHDIYDQKP